MFLSARVKVTLCAAGPTPKSISPGVLEVDSSAVGPLFLKEGDADLLGAAYAKSCFRRRGCYLAILATKLGRILATRIVIGEDCRMSKWNPIVSGRRAWAALRDLSRRWYLGVGAGPSRRVAANGFSPEAYRARQIMPKRPADVTWMETRLQLDGDRRRTSGPKNCALKIPLPIPCRGRTIPLPDDTQIKSIECLNYLIIRELSAMHGEFRASAAMLLAYFPCQQGNLERGRRSRLPVVGEPERSSPTRRAYQHFE
jgi:hypothetical protein